MDKSKKSKLNLDELKQVAYSFACRNKKIKELQKQLDETKGQFYSDVDDYLQCNDLGDSITLDYQTYAGTDFTGELYLKRIQKTSITFDPSKVEKALGKEYAQEVVLRRYEVNDIKGLITYLKECGVDPVVFKSFISITKTVDTGMLDRLEEVGKIKREQVEGCYTVNKTKPYFTIKAKRGQGGED